MAYGHKAPPEPAAGDDRALAGRGRSNDRMAAQTRMHVDTAHTWRGRFSAGGLPALADRERSGRPVSFTALQVAEVEAPACQLPAGTGTPLSRWSCPARRPTGDPREPRRAGQVSRPSRPATSASCSDLIAPHLPAPVLQRLCHSLSTAMRFSIASAQWS
ncbi:helix-turn-helix domain-containing protein [Streptomyces sp. NPDC101194]|uniref:helix-turn-helix domain-containing protein n=1 Tax=Streptomyces sp. NPDC101194 TaxID=3366127 RepID=UPI0038304B1C